MPKWGQSIILVAAGNNTKPKATELNAMLILTRRVGETINIGDDITVTVFAAKGNQVRIGVNAPKSVAVHREEVAERIKAEERAAVTARASAAR